jgi:hypothetical protein
MNFMTFIAVMVGLYLGHISINIRHKNANHPIVGRVFDWAAHDLFRT